MELNKPIFHDAIQRTFSTVQLWGLDALSTQELSKERGIKSLGVSRVFQLYIALTSYPEHIGFNH